jgi:hypothetical protein
MWPRGTRPDEIAVLGAAREAPRRRRGAHEEGAVEGTREVAALRPGQVLGASADPLNAANSPRPMKIDPPRKRSTLEKAG